MLVWIFVWLQCQWLCSSVILVGKTIKMYVQYSFWKCVIPLLLPPRISQCVSFLQFQASIFADSFPLFRRSLHYQFQFFMFFPYDANYVFRWGLPDIHSKIIFILLLYISLHISVSFSNFLLYLLMQFHGLALDLYHVRE